MNTNLTGAILLTALTVQIGAHVALVVGLARRKPRWRALVAAIVLPLAPVWGWSEMPKRAWTWAIAFAAYAFIILASQ